MSKLNLQLFLGVLYSFKGMQTSRKKPASSRFSRTLGAQTYWCGHPPCFLQGVNYDVHGWVGFVYKFSLFEVSLGRSEINCGIIFLYFHIKIAHMTKVIWAIFIDLI